MAEGYAGAPLGETCVLGLGKTGLAAAGYLARRLGGRVSGVTVYGGLAARESDETRALERAGCRVVLGTEEVEGSYDLAVASPGISEFSDFFSSARAHAREVVSEPELAWRESPARWLAVTGTNGKTTTTTLLRDLLRAGGLAAEAVGNIGRLAIGEVEGREEGSWLVAELSSYQLASTRDFRPAGACLLNVTPDHLSWHRGMDNYVAAKERAFRNMGPGDLAVVSDSDEHCRAVAARLAARGLRTCVVGASGDPGGECAAFLDGDTLVVRLDGEAHELARAGELAVAGAHNHQNALAASALALGAGVGAERVREGLLRFRPLEHRIEPCGEVDGVRYVNDSKATNVDAAQKALTAFRPGSVVLLAGGHDKGTDLAPLASDVARLCRVAVCYGEAGPRLAEAFRRAARDGGEPLEVLEAPHMAEALDRARLAARPGDAVLLSPACSSFDEFSSFEERGDAFKALVGRLACARAGRG